MLQWVRHCLHFLDFVGVGGFCSILGYHISILEFGESGTEVWISENL